MGGVGSVAISPIPMLNSTPPGRRKRRNVSSPAPPRRNTPYTLARTESVYRSPIRSAPSRRSSTQRYSSSVVIFSDDSQERDYRTSTSSSVSSNIFHSVSGSASQDTSSSFSPGARTKDGGSFWATTEEQHICPAYPRCHPLCLDLVFRRRFIVTQFEPIRW